jgi:CRISPR-associated endonuclease Cas2
VGESKKTIEFLKELGEWYGWQLFIYKNPYQALAGWSGYAYYKRRKYYNRMRYLRRKGYLKKSSKGYSLTKKSLELCQTSKKKMRDRRYWYLVCFDIPEQWRRKRSVLRSFLKRNGFRQLQKSIWISECDYRRELASLAVEMRINFYLKVFRVPKEDIRKYF